MIRRRNAAVSRRYKLCHIVQGRRDSAAMTYVVTATIPSSATTDRSAACNNVSSALRNADRSCRLSAAGPLVCVPDARRCSATARPASALPILSPDQTRPLADKARAPRFRQRAPSGISWVTHTSHGVIRSAIQSSAASGVSATTIICTRGSSDGRIGRDPLCTTCTSRLSRAATRYTSSRTGQASAST